MCEPHSKSASSFRHCEKPQTMAFLSWHLVQMLHLKEKRAGVKRSFLQVPSPVKGSSGQKPDGRSPAKPGWGADADPGPRAVSWLAQTATGRTAWAVPFSRATGVWRWNVCLGSPGSGWTGQPGTQHLAANITHPEKDPGPRHHLHCYGTQPTPNWETVLTNDQILTRRTAKPSISATWLLQSQKLRLCQVPTSPAHLRGCRFTAHLPT